MRFLNRVPRDWSTINLVRASFVSKALAAASISIIILPRSGFIEWVFGSNWNYYISLFGALLFLSGYLVPSLKATPEFRQPRSRGQHIEYWKSVASWGFFEARRDQLRSLCDRISETKSKPPDLSDGPLMHALKNLEDANKTSESDDWNSLQGAVYDADLELRGYDQHRLRCWVALMLYAGIAIIILPNLIIFVWHIVELIFGLT